MNPELGKATPPAGIGLANADSESSPIPPECRIAYGVWTPDIEALCRALDAQQQAHFRSTVPEEKSAAPLEE